MIIPLMLLFSGAILLASAVYATSRLNRQASDALVLARALERSAGRDRRKIRAEAPDGLPYAL